MQLGGRRASIAQAEFGLYVDVIVPGEVQCMEKGFAIVLMVRSATLSIQGKDRHFFL